MYDSVGQFYPWRHFAAHELRTGRIPLWNPYQFSGTPFVANSQSAVFYPGNLLYWLLPTDRAAGLTVMLHLCMAGWFTTAFLRSYRLSTGSALLGGIAFTFSTWQVSWLALPTFLCTSCWLPLALLRVRHLMAKPRWTNALALGGVIGVTLVAGHLQIAFYVLLAAILYAAWLAGPGRASLDDSQEAPVQRISVGPTAALLGVSVAVGGLLAAPQLLPSLELSRRSHRAASPTAQGFAAYSAYAVSPAAVSTLFLPDYYGNPADPANPYVGASRGGSYFNYAEGALYVGIPTLLLASFALIRARQIGLGRVGFFGLLALLALLLAAGTFLDALLYFYLPGFGQSGSPGRALVLWAFALACLAAFGYEKLCHDDAAPVKSAAMAIAGVSLVGVVALLIGPAAVFKGLQPANLAAQIPRQACLLLLSAGAILGLASGRLRGTRYSILPVALVAVDLLATGSGFNLTATSQEVYPETPSLAELKRLAGHDRIMPVNRGWSFLGPDAVLPPNGAMVFGLRDVQGYDSLFPGQYKAFMNELNGQDASPPEVGNMVFAKSAASPLASQAGVRYVLSNHALPLPGAVDSIEGYTRYDLPNSTGRAYVKLDSGESAPVHWIADDPTRVVLKLHVASPGALYLADQRYPGWTTTVDGRPARIDRINQIFRSVRVDAGSHTAVFAYRPAAFRAGLYLACIILGVAAVTVACRPRK
jgi:hypothetical protein